MRKLFAIALVLAGCDGGGETPSDGPGGDGPPGDTGSQGVPARPAAPTAGNRMYQGMQRDFHTQSGGMCKGRVAASMGNTSFCYLAADDKVKCAGVVAGVNYGMVPTDTGQAGATQIMVFFTDNGMCVAKTDRTVHCMGTNTVAFGNAITTTFSPWIARNDIEAIATGTWDQICGLTTGGQVYCGGNGYAIPPITVGAATTTALWVDSGGMAQLNDPAVLRPGETRTECTVRTGGLFCGGTFYGPGNGVVVSGGRGSSVAGGDFHCWLESTGTVGCTTGPRFAAGKVLYLAGNFLTESLCAIYNDGSIWCVGSNENGKLGTGNTNPLATETMVAPPGTARVRCD